MHGAFLSAGCPFHVERWEIQGYPFAVRRREPGSSDHAGRLLSPRGASYLLLLPVFGLTAGFCGSVNPSEAAASTGIAWKVPLSSPYSR